MDIPNTAGCSEHVLSWTCLPRLASWAPGLFPFLQRYRAHAPSWDTCILALPSSSHTLPHYILFFAVSHLTTLPLLTRHVSNTCTKIPHSLYRASLHSSHNHARLYPRQGLLGPHYWPLLARYQGRAGNIIATQAITCSSLTPRRLVKPRERLPRTWSSTRTASSTLPKTASLAPMLASHLYSSVLSSLSTVD